MSQKQVDAVIDCVDAVVLKRHPDVGVHNDWKMGADYRYAPENINQFLLDVKECLRIKHYLFSYQSGFGVSLLPKTLEEAKVEINKKTQEE